MTTERDKKQINQLGANSAKINALLDEKKHQPPNQSPTSTLFVDMPDGGHVKIHQETLKKPPPSSDAEPGVSGKVITADIKAQFADLLDETKAETLVKGIKVKTREDITCDDANLIKKFLLLNRLLIKTIYAQSTHDPAILGNILETLGTLFPDKMRKMPSFHSFDNLRDFVYGTIYQLIKETEGKLIESHLCIGLNLQKTNMLVGEMLAPFNLQDPDANPAQLKQIANEVKKLYLNMFSITEDELSRAPNPKKMKPTLQHR